MTQARGSPLTLTQRIGLSFALVPFIPALGYLLTRGLLESQGLTWWDGLREWQLCIAALSVLAVATLWKRLFLFALGRAKFSAVLSLVPFVQVAYGKPLWDAGCFANDALCFGQFSITLGLWIWLTVWVWWLVEKWLMAREETTPVRMSSTTVCLGFSLATLPLVFGAFMIIAIAAEKLSVKIAWTYSLTFTAVAVLEIALWLWVWWKAVRWDPRVAFRTWLLAIGCPVVTIGTGLILLIWDVGNELPYTLPVLGWGAWMAGTLLIWPLTKPVGPGPAGSAPSCPACAYSLRGLKNTRCPECGAEPTLDELWAAGTEEV